MRFDPMGPFELSPAQMIYLAQRLESRAAELQKDRAELSQEIWKQAAEYRACSLLRRLLPVPTEPCAVRWVSPRIGDHTPLESRLPIVG